MIYCLQLGEHWTLCNARGISVHLDGSLAYYPDIYITKPIGYPDYVDSVSTQGDTTN